MKSIFYTLLLSLLCATSCKTADTGSQVLADGPPNNADTLHAWLATRPHAPAQSEVSIQLTDERVRLLRGALDALWEGRQDEMLDKTRAAGFKTTAMIQNGRNYLLIYDEGPSGIDATLVVALDPKNELVVEVPHPDFEPGTMQEGADLLLRSCGRALIIAGAHRCASSRASACGGKTAVCSPDGVAIPYADTDAGHNAGSAFDTFHRALADRFQEARFVQLHGMREGDTWVILSDGSKANRPGQPAWPEQIRDALRPVLGADIKAVSCQDPGDAQRFNHRRLCGTDNTQGRLLNLSPDACAVVAPTATGRFLHIEQTFDVLGGDRPGGVVVDAILSTLPGC